MEYPNPINNPTLEGYDVLATSPEVKGAWWSSTRHTTARALVVRYAAPLESPVHILWQEKEDGSEEWRYSPGSNSGECERVIMALLGLK